MLGALQLDFDVESCLSKCLYSGCPTSPLCPKSLSFSIDRESQQSHAGQCKQGKPMIAEVSEQHDIHIRTAQNKHEASQEALT